MQPLIPEGIIILVTEQDFQAQQIVVNDNYFFPWRQL